jgi:hypothetical protein
MICRWSEHERRHHQVAASQQVLEDALQTASAHQVELWTFCLNRELPASISGTSSSASTMISDAETVDRIRRFVLSFKI